LRPSDSPEFEAGCLNQAAALMNRRNQPSLAVIYLERAVEVEPGRADYWMNLGAAQAAAGREQGALVSYERALDLGEPDVVVVPIMAELAIRLGRFADAEELLMTKLGRDRMGADELLLLGVAKCGQKQEEEGLAIFDEVLSLGEGDSATAHFNRGQALEALKRVGEAAVAYALALEVRPEYPAAAYHLGLLRVTEGRKDEGLVLIDQAIEWETNPIRKRELKSSREDLAEKADSGGVLEEVESLDLPEG
jgi:tetratricopeptide (TPR) repeat protein